MNRKRIQAQENMMPRTAPRYTRNKTMYEDNWTPILQNMTIRSENVMEKAATHPNLTVPT